MLAAILTFGFVLTACSNNDDPVVPPTDDVEAQLQKMTLREKVGQMFFIRMESLDPSIDWTTYDDLANIKIMEVTENMKAVNENYPVGGIILYAWNILVLCRPLSCKTSCAVNWGIRTSSSPTVWRWGLLHNNTPALKLL